VRVADSWIEAGTGIDLDRDGAPVGELGVDRVEVADTLGVVLEGVDLDSDGVGGLGVGRASVADSWRRR
jgi:hypothetical protein